MPVRPIDIRPYPHRVREDKHEHPGHDRFAALADAALAEIPAPFRNFLGPVPIQIMDFPTDEMLVNLGIPTPWGLLGLYHGIAVGEKSIGHVAPPVDMIFLFREPILAYATEMRAPVENVVRHVLVHEIGHHFGLSDEDMERIEDEG